MKAIEIQTANQLSYGDVETPEPGPGEVRVRATGICGTDVEIVDGVMPYYTGGLARYPVIPGHEWAGVVEAVGPGVTRFAPGDPVVGECSVGCGQCAVCLAGNYHRCPQRRETGILNMNGGFAEYLVFPALFLHHIAHDLPFATACLVEPSAVAFNGVRCTGVRPGDHVAIFGDGPIGLLTLQVARLFGASHVAVVGATRERLAKAQELGADAVIDVGQGDPQAALAAADGGRSPDAVIEATGNPDAANQALRSVRAGGRVTLLGIFGGQRATLDLDRLVTGDITLRGALGSPGIWPDVIDLIERGRLDPAAIISHQIALPDFAQGVEMVRQRTPGTVKVIVAQG